MNTKRQRKPQTPESDDWREKLSRLKKELPAPEPTAEVKKEWGSFSSGLQPTLMRASARLNISMDTLLAGLYTENIHLDAQDYQYRLNAHQFSLLIKKFAKPVYNRYRYYFDDILRKKCK